jgi:hypothetical protein
MEEGDEEVSTPEQFLEKFQSEKKVQWKWKQFHWTIWRRLSRSV